MNYFNKLTADALTPRSLFRKYLFSIIMIIWRPERRIVDVLILVGHINHRVLNSQSSLYLSVFLLGLFAIKVFIVIFIISLATTITRMV